MKNSLKFKKALAYYDNIDKALVIELEDGRYGVILTAREKAPNNVLKGHIGGYKMSYLRGSEITENIPNELIQKAKNILKNADSKIRISLS